MNFFLGECLIETGFYVFNTEAHPIDGAALDCCQRFNENKIDFNGILDHYVQLNLGFIKARERVIPSYCNYDFDKLKDIKNLDLIYSCNLSDYFKTRFQTMSSSGKFYYP